MSRWRRARDLVLVIVSSLGTIMFVGLAISVTISMLTHDLFWPFRLLGLVWAVFYAFCAYGTTSITRSIYRRGNAATA